MSFEGSDLFGFSFHIRPSRKWQEYLMLGRNSQRTSAKALGSAPDPPRPRAGNLSDGSGLSQYTRFGGSLRAQVLSFRRLGWRVFSETGGGQKVLIGGIGKRMLLRRILLKHRLQLKAFARSATRPGMADLLAQAIGEFKTYRIAPDDLRRVKNTNGILFDKLQDLSPYL